jgi:predicted esterase
MLGEGFKPYELLFDRLIDIPMWHIHGDSDIIIPLEAAEKTVNDFIDAGVNVKFTVLKDHDHNVWTDTYLNHEIYDWFLQYSQ